MKNIFTFLKGKIQYLSILPVLFLFLANPVLAYKINVPRVQAQPVQIQKVATEKPVRIFSGSKINTVSNFLPFLKSMDFSTRKPSPLPLLTIKKSGITTQKNELLYTGGMETVSDFTVNAKKSDLNIKKLYFDVTKNSGKAKVDVSAELYDENGLLASSDSTYNGISNTIKFDDLKYPVNKNETKNLSLKIRIDNYVEGDFFHVRMKNSSQVYAYDPVTTQMALIHGLPLNSPKITTKPETVCVSGIRVNETGINDSKITGFTNEQLFKFDITACAESDVKFTYLKLDLSGEAAKYVKIFHLYNENGVLYKNGYYLKNGTTVFHNFSKTIKAGETETFYITADFYKSLTSGKELLLKIPSADFIKGIDEKGKKVEFDGEYPLQSYLFDSYLEDCAVHFTLNPDSPDSHHTNETDNIELLRFDVTACPYHTVRLD